MKSNKNYGMIEYGFYENKNPGADPQHSVFDNSEDETSDNKVSRDSGRQTNF